MYTLIYTQIIFIFALFLSSHKNQKHTTLDTWHKMYPRETAFPLTNVSQLLSKMILQNTLEQIKCLN